MSPNFSSRIPDAIGHSQWHPFTRATPAVVHVVDYGPIDVNGGKEESYTAVYTAIKNFYEGAMKGYRHDSSYGGIMSPQKILCDANYMPD